MNSTTKLLLASVSPVALAAGTALFASPAQAQTTFLVTGYTYATENFISPSTATGVAIPSASVHAVQTVATSGLGGGTITLTLSSGAFLGVITPAATAGGANLNTSSFGTGSTSLTYVLTAQTTTAAAITFGAFNLGSVNSRLSTHASSITLTYGNSSNIMTPATTVRTLAVGGQVFTFNVNNTNNTIDLANGGSGLIFRATANTSNVSFATLGTLLSASTAANDITGTTAFTAGASDFVRATVSASGGLSAFSSLYLTTASCAASAPTGALTGSVASDSRSVSFSSIAPTVTYNFCGVATGTTIIPSQTMTASFAMTFASRTVNLVTYTPGSAGSNPTALASTTVGAESYNGGTGTAFYVVGTGSYTSAIRVTNTSGSSGAVFVQVTPDTTGTAVRALLDSTLAANQAKFYFATDIRNAVGTSVLINDSNRATVVFLATFGSLDVQNFILNPGGILSGGVRNSN
jgi:hypothetical protein